MLRTHLKTHNGEKLNKCNQCNIATMQPVRLYIFSGRQVEDTSENAQWRKAKQMQAMQLCIFSYRHVEDSFENTQWRKVKQMETMWLCLFSGGYIWKHTVAKSRRNATDLLHPTYLHIWKRTVEKFHINAVSVNMYPLSSAICGSFVKTVTLKQGQIVFWKNAYYINTKETKPLKTHARKCT